MLLGQILEDTTAVEKVEKIYKILMAAQMVQEEEMMPLEGEEELLILGYTIIN